MECRPIVKWAGGKGRLLSSILPLVPARVGTYCEPFVGGGALFFALASETPRRFERAVLCDANEELIICYRAIKRDVDGVLRALGRYKATKAVFLKTRALDPTKLADAKRAARFIFLNRTCFNGLYRVNSKNQFNVPYGRYRSPRIRDVEGLRAASAALRCAQLVHGDFTDVTKKLGAKDFVYFDPPYIPTSDTADFTAYTKAKFTPADHARLAREMRRLRRARVRVVLSNADAGDARALYKTFERRVIMAPRAINCDGAKRGPVRELLLVG